MTNSEFQEIGMYLQIAQIAHSIDAVELKARAVDFADYKLQKAAPSGILNVAPEIKLAKFEES